MIPAKMIRTISILVLSATIFAPQVIAATKWYQAPPLQGLDTWFGNVYSTTSQNASPKLLVGGWGDEYHTLLRFDLSGLPQVTTNAAIWFYASPGGNGFTGLQWTRVTKQWDRGTVGWSNAPIGNYVGSIAAPAVAGWYGVNITSFYNTWRQGNPNDQLSLNYGFRVWPVSNNNVFTQFVSSYNPAPNQSPYLQIDYTPQPDDGKIKLKWPLSTPHASTGINTRFGDPSLLVCSDGAAKQHNGVDYHVVAGTTVYAAEDGIVKEVHYDSSGRWAYNIVIEHNHPAGGKFTTVSWHVNPLVAIGNFVPKGFQIATVANLGTSTHFHFGVRVGAYIQNLSGTGGLPYKEHGQCDGYPIFRADFVDHEDANNVLFQ